MDVENKFAFFFWIASGLFGIIMFYVLFKLLFQIRDQLVRIGDKVDPETKKDVNVF